ncbi:MAG TPA: hypothetical protein DCP92_02425 [Nitrospiraceae bacterium]|nr:hypothetical protein [Nitrospiraceae bacterium]
MVTNERRSGNDRGSGRDRRIFNYPIYKGPERRHKPNRRYLDKPQSIFLGKYSILQIYTCIYRSSGPEDGYLCRALSFEVIILFCCRSLSIT